ncbi:phosphopantothenoylcysteine decarboxylase domain-containing protein [Vagococcus elongatus]|uniref:DNA/pantothenate metabolism flavoprotein C-terminal domain-containing protein n=1 Tax=Vagococcus elongatus TaxID=180344 RepID=A0A430AQI8_9ENTE|nr:phosphopantothenoylcysteine decarboxylase [Vagococcus elongatus]RSU10325.1 hypothetical protein CBF29_09950 [Vagococcus elongatus]
MNILITAGGTKEKIDDVRYIANHSTGKLGAAMAEAFAKDAENSIVYLHGTGAIVPRRPNVFPIEIFSTEDLKNQLENQLNNKQFTAVIHSMAVSDYTVSNTFSESDFLSAFSEKIPITQETSQLLWTKDELLAALEKQFEAMAVQEKNKISSNFDHLLIRLEKNPKIIQKIKLLQPETILVGFKLLVDTSETNLVSVARNLLEKNNCDYVLANDLTTIKGDKHHGILVGSDQSTQIAETKQEIAEIIVNTIKDKSKTRENK